MSLKAEMSYTYKGLGMPRPPKRHQQVLYYIAHNINALLMDSGVEAYPEIRADEGNRNSLSPDVGVYFPGRFGPVLIVEVSENRDSASEFRRLKLEDYTAWHQRGRFDFEELFHVDMYRNRIDLHLFSVANRSLPRQDLIGVSYSRLLDFDLRELCLHFRDFRAKYG